MKRTRPNIGSSSVVGSRDLDALASIAWAGLLTTSQLERLHFPSRRKAQRRLRALLDHGFVRAHLQGEALHKENVYTLTPKGRDFLVEEGRVDETVKLRRLPRLQKLAHTLGIRETFVAFLEAERRGMFTVRDFRFDDELAAEPVFEAAGIIPDAVAVIEVGTETRVVGVEYDRGTETRAMLRKKFEGWARLFAAPGSPWRTASSRLLIVLEREQKQSTIVRLVDEMQLANRIRIAVLVELQGVLVGAERQG